MKARLAIARAPSRALARPRACGVCVRVRCAPRPRPSIRPSGPSLRRAGAASGGQLDLGAQVLNLGAQAPSPQKPGHRLAVLYTFSRLFSRRAVPIKTNALPCQGPLPKVGQMNPNENGIFDPNSPESGDQPGDLSETEVGHHGQQRMEVDSSKYYKTGFVGVSMAADGMPAVGGDGPPEQEDGLTDANFICAESSDGTRPECVHLVTLVLPADGVAKGFGEMRQIRQFCRWLATGSEQWEHRGNVYACNARSPQDLVSIRIVRDFRQRQKDLAAETSEKSGKLDF